VHGGGKARTLLRPALAVVGGFENAVLPDRGIQRAVALGTLGVHDDAERRRFGQALVRGLPARAMIEAHADAAGPVRAVAAANDVVVRDVVHIRERAPRLA